MDSTKITRQKDGRMESYMVDTKITRQRDGITKITRQTDEGMES